jgi:hypothetical protein
MRAYACIALDRATIARQGSTTPTAGDTRRPVAAGTLERTRGTEIPLRLPWQFLSIHTTSFSKNNPARSPARRNGSGPSGPGQFCNRCATIVHFG